MDFFSPHMLFCHFHINSHSASTNLQTGAYDFIIFDLLVDRARAYLSGVPLRPKPLRR